jgi:hypothetical protein
MDLEGPRVVWLRVGAGLASLAGDDRLWSEPAAVRKALLELVGVFPATHLEIDLAAVRAAGGDGAWEALLAGSGEWKGRLAELCAAVGDALGGRATWGITLPDPRSVSSEADGSEKAALKSGLQLAGALRHLRETSIGFVTIDLAENPPHGLEKALAPTLRNAQLYGWGRAIAVGGAEEAERWASAVEAVLVRDVGVGALETERRGGLRVAGGLDGRFWLEGRLDAAPPPAGLLFGILPAGIEAKQVVDSGRELRGALQA